MWLKDVFMPWLCDPEKSPSLSVPHLYSGESRQKQFAQRILHRPLFGCAAGTEATLTTMPPWRFASNLYLLLSSDAAFVRVRKQVMWREGGQIRMWT